MLSRRLSTLATGAALVALLSGCTGSSDSAAEKTSTPTTTPTAEPASAEISKYWPIAEGNTWVYSSDYGDMGTVTTTQKMTTVTENGDDIVVAFETTTHFDSGILPDQTSSVDYVFHEDGSLTIPSQSLANTLGASTDTSFTVSGDDMTWPSDKEFDSGTVSAGRIAVSGDANGIPINVDIDFSIFGVGEEEVSVPAGSYTARKLQQDMTITMPGIGSGVNSSASSWLVEGVGMVKGSTPDIAGGSGSTVDMVLESFTEGS